MVKHRRWLADGSRSVGFLLLTFLIACAPSTPAGGTSPGAPAPKAQFSPELSALIEAAQREGGLNVSWGGSTLGGPAGAKRFEEGVNKYYGTNLRFNYTPGLPFPSHAAKLVDELQAGKAAHVDALLLGSSSLFILEGKNALLPVDWEALSPQIPRDLWPTIRAPDNTYVSFVGRLWAFVYNTSLIPRDQAPRSLQALLDPKWKGKI